MVRKWPFRFDFIIVWEESDVLVVPQGSEEGPKMRVFGVFGQDFLKKVVF